MLAREHDVVIVGASLAGCAAATLLGRQGLDVALVERSPAADAHKGICTHFIQPGASPAIERLGLSEQLAAAGAVPNAIHTWTRYGWVPHPGPDFPHGWSIRREWLDPMVRDLAAGTAGVELHLGWRADELLRDGRRITGVVARGADGSRRTFRARLVVAADGRASELATLAGVPCRTWLTHRRYAYYGYFRNLTLDSGTVAQMWFLDPAVAYAFPNEDGVTLVAYWGLRDELPEVRADIDGTLRARLAELPAGPRLDEAEQIGAWRGKVDMPNVRRAPVHDGMALIGDAAQASDPVWGVGCGWAFQTAEWLAEAVGPALTGGCALPRALRRYRVRHTRELLLAHVIMSEYARGRRFRLVEKLMFAAAARDPVLARHVHRYAARLLAPQWFITPPVLVRACAALVRRRPLIAPSGVPEPARADERGQLAV